MKPAEFKRIRQGMRLTQAELARTLGVTRAAVSRWESGNRSIDSVLVLALEHLKEHAVRSKGGRHAKGRK